MKLSKGNWTNSLLTNSVYLIVGGLFIIPAIFVDKFVNAASLTSLLNGIALWGIMALGIMLVLILGQTDLSIGMNVSMITIFSVLLATSCGIVVAIIVSILIGLVAGMVNGSLVAYCKVNSFIATLGTMLVYKGIGLSVSGGKPVTTSKAESYKDTGDAGFHAYASRVGFDCVSDCAYCVFAIHPAGAADLYDGR